MYRLLVIIGLLILLLVGRFFFFFKDTPILVDDQQLTFQTTLLTQPQTSGKFQSLSVRLSHGQRIFLTTPMYPSYQYGDTLRVSGKLRIVTGDRGVLYTMRFPTIEILPQEATVITLLLPLRQRIITFFQHSLSEPEGSLLLGMTFGISEAMPKDFQVVLQNAGVLHVIAASGMNVTMVASLLMTVFGRAVKRQYGLALSIMAIGLYAVLSGLSASIVRAAIMGSLVFGAQLLGRQTMALHLLFVAGFLMLFWEPFLVFDTGFQLSFMATWGLIVFSPLIQQVFSKESTFGIWTAETDLSTTIVAQIVTLPILLGTFGTYSFASIFANMLVLWMVPLLMIIGGLGTAIGLFIPVLGTWILYLGLPFLLFFETVVWFFGSLPLSISLSQLPWPMTLGYYCILFALLLRLQRKNQS